jgi:hypothetical protein
MAIQHSEERRRAPRIPVLVRVECRTPQNYTVGNCQNISETGMLVKTREVLRRFTGGHAAFCFSSGIDW